MMIYYMQTKKYELHPHIFEHSFIDQEVISLNKKDFHHEINVLRKKGDKFVLFDGVVHV